MIKKLKSRLKHIANEKRHYEQCYEEELKRVRGMSALLNKIRATLISKYGWSGAFTEEQKDLADVIEKICIPKYGGAINENIGTTQNSSSPNEQDNQ